MATIFLTVISRIYSEPIQLEEKLNLIPGVIENGLFIGMADMVISLNRKRSDHYRAISLILRKRGGK